METFEVQGQWWAPDTPDHKVGGTLTLAEDEFTLRTTASLSPDDFPEPDFNPSRIHGDAGGHEYTLDDCFPKSRTVVFGRPGGSPEIYVVNRVIRGAWFDKTEDIVCKHLSTRMKHFGEWFGHSGISTDWTYRQRSKVRYNLAFKSQRATVSRWRDSELRIKHWYNFDQDQPGSYSVSEDRMAEFGYQSPALVEDALAQASDLQDLVTIATERQAEYLSVKFTNPAIKRGRGKHRSLVPIEFFARWTVKDEVRKRSPRQAEMLFTFDDIDGAQGVAAWMEVAERYRTELGRVIASRFRDGMAVEDRFFNVAASLQGVDETATGYRNSKYRARLKRLADTAGSPFARLVGNIDIWLDRVVYVRDDHAHHYKRGFVGTEHLFLGRSAYWLFVLWMLREARMPDVVFDKIEKAGSFKWEGERIRALLGT